jgi:amino acid adenylation domain-containing protein
MNLFIQDLVSAQADRRPEAPAIVAGDEVMSFELVETQSTQLARALRESGCRRGDRVCVLTPKTPAAIMAIIAIYKADCVYVPLDISSPAPRLAKIFKAADPQCTLIASSTKAPFGALLRAVGATSPVLVGSLDAGAVEGEEFRSSFSMADLARVPVERLSYRNWPDDTAHLMFTSASTGTPKGVMITHAAVRQFVLWANHYFGVRREDRHSGHSPLALDLSILDVFGTLAAGACLYPVAPDLNVFPNRLAAFMRSSALTQWCSVPSVMSYMAQLDVLEFNDFPQLKRVMWCGDVLPTRALRYWMLRLPHVKFTNLYGPTEATIASSCYTLPECPRDESVQVPIGEARAGTELLILDPRLQLLPPNEHGELYIRGGGLSPGYWNDESATARAFIPNPHSDDPSDRLYRTGDLAHVGRDGLVYFEGRADSQIQSRGHRIDLGEIEAALRAVPCLIDSAVVAIKSDGFEGTNICCAYAPQPGVEVTPAVLRRLLSELLPPYMLPSHWKAYQRLPLNAQGRLDRLQVATAFTPRAARAS